MRRIGRTKSQCRLRNTSAAVLSEMTIGRAPGATLVLSDPTVSRVHARISEGAPPFTPTRFALMPLIAELAPALATGSNQLSVEPAVPAGLVVRADRARRHGRTAAR